MRTDSKSLVLDLHPLCTLFPRMSGAEFDALKADILANGQREAIVLHDGFILDGGNRYRACIEAGVEPEFKDFIGSSPVTYVLSANLHRRHLTPGQQAAIVASAQDWASAQPANRPGKGGNVAGLSTVADRAAQSGASDRTQRMADTVAKKSPDLARQVAHGEISLPKAMEQLAPPKSVPGRDHSDAPDFGVVAAKTTAPPPATVSLDDLDGDDIPDALDQLREEQAKVEQLQDQLDALTARVKLLSEGDLAARVVALEQDLTAARNLSTSHFEKWTEANTKAIDYKKLLDKLRKLAGVEKYGDLAGCITLAAKG